MTSRPFKLLQTNMKKLSVVLAVRDEEKNIGRCLESVKEIANEIVVVDEYSTDKTVEIAKKYKAKVYEEPHRNIFHITKQKALEKAEGDWILQLDADERVTDELAKEIREVINMTSEEVKNRRSKEQKKYELFRRHERLIEERDGPIGKETGEVVAFFIPRINIFLGKPLRYAGVYPDGVIRLVKRGKARFPQKSVHEQIEIDGEVAWLFNGLEHYDSPTLSRYLERANRYTSLTAKEFEQKKLSKNLAVLFFYSLVMPLLVFLKLFIRHKGFLEGTRGFLWSFLSALHFPIAYFKYWTGDYKT